MLFCAVHLMGWAVLEKWWRIQSCSISQLPWTSAYLNPGSNPQHTDVPTYIPPTSFPSLPPPPPPPFHACHNNYASPSVPPCLPPSFPPSFPPSLSPPLPHPLPPSLSLPLSLPLSPPPLPPPLPPSLSLSESLALPGFGSVLLRIEPICECNCSSYEVRKLCELSEPI